MHEINCPECGKLFKIDETGYSNILKQVRNDEFQTELGKRLQLADQDKVKSIELAKQNLQMDMQESVSTKETKIQHLQMKLDASLIEMKLAVKEASNSLEKERDTLAYKLEKIKETQEATKRLAINEAVSEFQKESVELKSSLERAEIEKKLAEKSLKE